MTTGRINQVCQLLLRYMQHHVTMGPYGSAAQMQQFASHSKCSPILGTTLLGKRNLPLDTSKLHFSNHQQTVLKHKPPAHTQKLCVIKQLHSTQRVSMTTKKLIGNSQRECLCTQTHSIGRWVPEASTSCHAMSSMSVEGCPPQQSMQAEALCTQNRSYSPPLQKSKKLNRK